MLHTSRGYVLGKLLHILVQECVFSSPVGIIYERALLDPGAIFGPALQRLQWLGKGDAIASCLPLPKTAFSNGGLLPQEEAEFARGYYDGRIQDIEAMMVILPLEAIQWVKQQGGSQFIGRLIECERRRTSSS